MLKSTTFRFMKAVCDIEADIHSFSCGREMQVFNGTAGIWKPKQLLLLAILKKWIWTLVSLVVVKQAWSTTADNDGSVKAREQSR